MIKIEKLKHKGYKEWEKAQKEGLNFRCSFGKYQYIYKSKKGEISLIYLRQRTGKPFWEIYCTSGSLFRDVERFGTKKEADIKIKNYLK